VEVKKINLQSWKRGSKARGTFFDLAAVWVVLVMLRLSSAVLLRVGVEVRPWDWLSRTLPDLRSPAREVTLVFRRFRGRLLPGLALFHAKCGRAKKWCHFSRRFAPSCPNAYRQRSVTRRLLLRKRSGHRPTIRIVEPRPHRHQQPLGGCCS